VVDTLLTDDGPSDKKLVLLSTMLQDVVGVATEEIVLMISRRKQKVSGNSQKLKNSKLVRKKTFEGD
jgi:hypothetical protein